MTDLVERLRDVRKRFASGTPQFTDQLEFVTSEAADEIERLQAQLDARRNIDRYVTFVLAGREDADIQSEADRVVAEVERLQSRNAALCLALERVNSRFLLAISGKPVRDAAETLAEVAAAMKERQT